MDDPLLALPGYVLTRAAAASLAKLNAALAAIECRRTDVSLLLLIEANPGITASDAGRALDIARANMVPLINRLESQFLLTRKALDGRSHGLFLSSVGEAKLTAAKSVITAHEDAMMDAVSAPLRPHLLPILMAIWKASGAPQSGPSVEPQDQR
jgi:DNA-binding MarR family transcriptional regulator